MIDEESARLALPLLRAGQAQKELWHNEALALIDLVVQASVVAVGVDQPPAAPAVGACWVVGAAPTGNWAGQAGAIAGWTTGGWRFVAPFAGLSVWRVTDGLVARYVAGTWVLGEVNAARVTIGGVQVVGARGAAIANPSGGSVADGESRAAIGAILAALRGHGLIAG